MSEQEVENKSVSFSVCKRKNGIHHDFSDASHNGTISQILAYKEKNLLIISSWDNKISFWKISSEDGGNFDLIKTMDSSSSELHGSGNTNDVRHMIKFGDEVFLYCSNNSNIVSISLNSMCPVKFFDKVHSTAVTNLVMISNDVFASGSNAGKMCLTRYSTNEVIHSTNLSDSQDDTLLRICKPVDHRDFRNCVLFTSMNEDEIYLYNYETSQRIRKFEAHEHDIYCIRTYTTQTKRHILVSGANDNYIIFWDLTTSEVIKKLKMGSAINDFLFISNNQYLIASGDLGEVYLVDLINDWNIITKEDIFSTKNYVYTIEWYDDRKNLTFYAGSSGGHIRMVKINNLVVTFENEDEAEMDLKERLNFILMDSQAIERSEIPVISIMVNNIKISMLLVCFSESRLSN